MASSILETYRDLHGSISIHRRHGLVFDQDCDSSIVGLCQSLDLFSRHGPIPKSRITGDLLVRTGLLHQNHMIDVTADDPADYRYVAIASGTTFDYGAQRHTPVSAIAWRALQEYIFDEYLMTKATGTPRFAQVDVVHRARRTVFRRLLLPLGDRGRVTHLLIAFRPDLLGVVSSTLDQIGPGVNDNRVVFPFRRPMSSVVVRPIEDDALSGRLVSLATRWLSLEDRTIGALMRRSLFAGDKAVFVRFNDLDATPTIVYATDTAFRTDPSYRLVRRFVSSDALGRRVQSFDLSDPWSSVRAQCFYIPFEHGAQRFGVVIY